MLFPREIAEKAQSIHGEDHVAGKSLPKNLCGFESFHKFFVPVIRGGEGLGYAPN